MSIRTLLVDDEPLARRGLELRLRKHADIDIVGEAGNGREAFHAISSLKPRFCPALLSAAMKRAT